MESQVMLGIVVFVLFIVTIGLLVKYLSKGSQEAQSVDVNPIGEYRPTTKVFSTRNSTANKFGRYKITLAGGTQKTLVGNLATILEVNNVESYYEIK